MRSKVSWILSDERLPNKSKWYRVFCINGRIYKCKFIKEKNGPKDYSSSYFKHKKRALRDYAWRENEYRNS